LAKLTSGERFLIGIVGQKIYGGYGGPTGGGSYFLPLQLPYNGILDMSNINSITITCSMPQEGSPSLYAFGRQMGHFDSETTFNPSDGNILVSLRATQGPTKCEFTITSFTTTDGKVHTADNLNY
jgi:hypothetical protein